MSNLNIGTSIQDLHVGKEFPVYTGVVLHVGQNDSGNEIAYYAGDETGYVLEVTDSRGTQEMANGILAALKLRGVKYQPYDASNAVVNPAAEMGDAVTTNGTVSYIAAMNRKFSRTMFADIAAPYDQEVNHEYNYSPQINREFKRESAYTRSRITQTESQIALEVARATQAEGTLSGRITVEADRITSEVTRATTAEGTLSSRIAQNATDITAKVSKSGGEAASFGWTLTDNSWTLYSNNSAVLSVNSSGLSVTGGGSFSGDISAASATFGTITITGGSLTGIGSSNVSAGGLTQYNMNSYSQAGIGGGYGFTTAQSQATPVGSFYGNSIGVFTQLDVYQNGRFNLYGSMYWQGTVQIKQKSLTFQDYFGDSHTIYYLGYN